MAYSNSFLSDITDNSPTVIVKHIHILKGDLAFDAVHIHIYTYLPVSTNEGSGPGTPRTT